MVFDFILSTHQSFIASFSDNKTNTQITIRVENVQAEIERKRVEAEEENSVRIRENEAARAAYLQKNNDILEHVLALQKVAMEHNLTTLKYKIFAGRGCDYTIPNGPNINHDLKREIQKTINAFSCELCCCKFFFCSCCEPCFCCNCYCDNCNSNLQYNLPHILVMTQKHLQRKIQHFKSTNEML